MSDTANTSHNLRRLAIDRTQRPTTGGGSSRGLLLGIVLAVAAIAGGGAVWYYQTTGLSIVAAMTERPVAVRLMTVAAPSSGAAPVVLVATGKIVSDQMVFVATKVSGQIVELHVEQGDAVERNQVLARIEDVVYRAARDEAAAQVAGYQHAIARAEAERVRAEAAVAEARANREFAERDFSRLERLHRSRQASEQEYLDAKSRFEAAAAAQQVALAAAESAAVSVRMAESQLAAGEAALRMAQKRLDDCAIRAPISGVVLERNAQVGDFLAAEGGRGANANAQLVSIADMTQLRVEIDVSERDIARIRPDQPARITPDANRERTFDGHVMWVDPIGDYARATVQVKVRIASPGPQLRIDGSAKVEFLGPAASQPAGGPTAPTAGAPRRAIWLPKEAVKLTAGSGGGAVFTIADGRAVEHAVTIGARTDEMVEVLSGAHAGMLIVADQVDRLTDGAKVEPVDAAAP